MLMAEPPQREKRNLPRPWILRSSLTTYGNQPKRNLRWQKRCVLRVICKAHSAMLCRRKEYLPVWARKHQNGEPSRLRLWPGRSWATKLKLESMLCGQTIRYPSWNSDGVRRTIIVFLAARTFSICRINSSSLMINRLVFYHRCHSFSCSYFRESSTPHAIAES